MVTFLTPLASSFEAQKGSIGLALTFLTRTENQNQMSFYPFALREISVLTELVFGHPRCLVEDVPPQPNSPPKCVLGGGRRGRANAPVLSPKLAVTREGQPRSTHTQ